MRRKLALLVAAAALASPVGCIGDGVLFGVGGGWAGDWSVPAPIAEPDRYTGVDFSVTPFFSILGLYHYSDGDESFTAPYAAWDLGFAACLLTEYAWWPVLKPVVGRYRWSESPEERGWLTGFKAGAAVLLGVTDSAMWFASYEHGWFNAHDAVGEDDARFQTARFALFCAVEF